MVLLRNLRDRARQHVAARQLSGNTQASHCPPHVTDEYRIIFAIGRKRAPIWLDRAWGCNIAHRSNARYAEAP